MIRKALITIGASVALVAGVATPALAQGNPVTASVSVAQSVTITGLSPTINLGSAVPGTTATATAAQSYSVSTNDPNGYVLSLGACYNSACNSVQPPPGANPGGAFTDPSGDFINNFGDLTVTETATAPQALTNWIGVSGVGPTPIQINQTSSASTDAYQETWALGIPASQPANTYSETFEYVVTAR